MNMQHETDNATGAVTTPEEGMTEEQFLEEYKKQEYPKPSLTADIAVFRHSRDGVELLLIRRARHPFRSCWALPGGFVDPNEDVIDAARRELEEETGITNVSLEPFGIYGTPGRDPRGWTVSGGFCALVESAIDAKAGDDAADARWWTAEATFDDSDARGTYTLSLRCLDEEPLLVRFDITARRFGAPCAHVVDSSGFAFDHAQLVADAYLKVTHGIQ